MDVIDNMHFETKQAYRVKNILVVDTETTGLHPDKGDKLIEIAAVLYNLEHKTVLQSLSSLFPCASNPVQHINGISAEASRVSICHNFINDQLRAMIDNSTCIVAHNAPFDRKFVNTMGIEEFEKLPWICTVNDFNWCVPLNRKKLQDVCQAMDVAYVNAHRAMNDCMFMIDCFNKMDNLEEMFEQAYLKKM